MNFRQIAFLTGLFLVSNLTLWGQKIPAPNFSLKSPETLEIIEVEISGTETIIRASITNLIENGYFCLDRNTYLITGSGSRLKLTGLKGLPFCPRNHEFGSIGEKVYFSMSFPPLPAGTGPW